MSAEIPGIVPFLRFLKHSFINYIFQARHRQLGTIEHRHGTVKLGTTEHRHSTVSWVLQSTGTTPSVRYYRAQAWHRYVRQSTGTEQSVRYYRAQAWHRQLGTTEHRHGTVSQVRQSTGMATSGRYVRAQAWHRQLGTSAQARHRQLGTSEHSTALSVRYFRAQARHRQLGISEHSHGSTTLRKQITQ